MEVRKRNIALDGVLLPPPPDVCPQCACQHPPELPHNQQSMFWQYWFYQQTQGRWPTWHDAMAHCTDEMKQRWTTALAEHGIDLSTPAPDNYTPDPGEVPTTELKEENP